jgi:hypothetical protein
MGMLNDFILISLKIYPISLRDSIVRGWAFPLLRSILIDRWIAARLRLILISQSATFHAVMSSGSACRYRILRSHALSRRYFLNLVEDRFMKARLSGKRAVLG